MGDNLVMSKKERKALIELNLVKNKKQTLVEMALRLDLDYRQVRRMFKRFLEEGDEGVIHRSRGKVSNRRFPEEFRENCLELYALRMSGFGPTFAAEKLEELGYKINHETLRGWLKEAQLWAPARKRGPHRQWREPKKHFGEMIQMDGSFHDWFEDGNNYCLMDMVDDATGRTYAQFYNGETTAGAMKTLWNWIEKYGIPRSLYTDRKNVYVTDRKATLEEELAGDEPLTAFGKSCQKLGIRIIEAHSAQAKGRVERKNGVFQDRLIKDMSFHGIGGMEAGNKWLEEKFLKDLNKRFVRKPMSEEDLHQKLTSEYKLENIFVWTEDRKVQSDWLIRWNNRWFQLLKKSTVFPPAKKDVTVQERLDGSVRIVYRETEIQYKEIQKPKLNQEEKPIKKKVPTEKKPSPDHPWRRSFLSTGKKTTKVQLFGEKEACQSEKL